MTADTSITRLTLPPLPPAIAKGLTTAQSVRLDAQHAGLPQSLDQCITCAGRKTFRWYHPSGRDRVIDYDCPCADQFVLHRVLLHHGVALAYQRYGWADFDYLPDSARDWALDYLENCDQYLSYGFGIVLSGPRGNGKTLLANLMVKDLIAKGKDCYVATFAEIINQFAQGWRDEEQARWFHTRVRNADVLVIDDIGREPNRGKPGAIGESTLEEMVRYRVAQLKPTFLTTNFTHDQVTQGYGGHTVSLLSERSVSCFFEGADRRAETNQRLNGEIRQRLTRPVVLR